VLKALSWGPLHAFEIISWIDARSAQRLQVDDGALFQALHRMEERKLIDADWGVTENNRRARYYRMTATGRAHLRTESARLADYATALTAVLGAKSA